MNIKNVDKYFREIFFENNFFLKNDFKIVFKNNFGEIFFEKVVLRIEFKGLLLEKKWSLFSN